MLWGYANGWYPDAFLTEDENELWAKLKFLKRYGFRETSVDLDVILDLSEAERDTLGVFLEEHDLHLTPMIWYDYVRVSDEEAAREEARIVEGLKLCKPLLRNWSIFTKAGAGQRFDRDMPVEEKLDRLSRRLAALAAAAYELGTPLGINNQGDFYVDDFIALCEATPHLSLHIDTSNIFWAGESIFPAFEKVAPYTIGTHWRDEMCVIGNRSPRGVMLENCVTGDGDVPLRDCYRLLLEKAPQPDRLVMELELFVPRGSDPVEGLRRAIAYLNTYDGVSI